MKKTFSLITIVACLNLLPLLALSQTMLVWEKSYGGSLFEQPFGSEPTADGGIILGGHSISNDGDLTSNYGDYDYWVFKVDHEGNMIWQKSYGGSLYDKARYATENPDGTVLAFGSVKSNDSDVVGNHNPGTNDYWLIKVNNTGSIIWGRCYGGTQEEGGRSVIRTHGGNYLCAGYSHSTDGDVTDHIGAYDVWLVMVEPDSGNILWAKSYGGSLIERVRSIYQWPNGDFVFSGNTESTDYDLAGTVNNGDEDFYAARIDSLGNVIWSVQYGGPGKDRAFYVTRDADGNVLLAGRDSLNGGYVTDNQGGVDVWVMKLDYTDGSMIWNKSFGGTADDDGFRIDPTQDGGYIIGAGTESDDGDSPGNRGFRDYWFIKVDAALNIQWTRTDGGGSWDHLNDIVITDDGGYIGVGFSSSDPGPNSEVTGNHGSFDYWLCKIVYCDSMAAIIPGGSVTICPGDAITLYAPLAESYLWSTGNTTQSISVSAAGTYTVQITRANGTCVRTSLPTTVSFYSTVQPVISINGTTLTCTTPAPSYQWYLNGTAIAGATTNILTDADTCGFYYVQVTDSNNCIVNSDSVFCPLSVDELSGIIKPANLFPNPAGDKITLQVEKFKAQSFLIYNSMGETVIKKNISYAANNLIEINIAALPRGLYFLKIITGSGYKTGKFVKD